MIFNIIYITCQDKKIGSEHWGECPDPILWKQSRKGGKYKTTDRQRRMLVVEMSGVEPESRLSSD